MLTMKLASPTGRKTFAIALAALCIAALALSTAAPVLAKPPQGSQGASDLAPRGKAKGHQPPLDKGWILNVTAEGTAVKINDSSVTEVANVTFNATVSKSSMGRARLNVTVGWLKIGDTAYDVERGQGIIALRGKKLLVHLLVSTPDDAKLHVVLKGKLTGNLSDLEDVDGLIDVDFLKPQSKLVGRFFLDLSGNVTRVE